MSMGWYGMLCCVFTMEKKLFSLTDFTSNTIQKPSILPAVEVMSWAQPTNIMSKSCSSNSSGIRSFRVQRVDERATTRNKKIGNGKIGDGPTQFSFYLLFWHSNCSFCSLVDSSLSQSLLATRTFQTYRERESGYMMNVL